VVAPTARTGKEEFKLRRLDKPEEFRAAEELAALVGVDVGETPVPVPLQRTVQDNGGLLLGAFVDIYLAGFSFGFLGWDGKTLYLYSQLMAVRPEYQNHHVGRMLKLRQREEVLALGLSEVRWSFDPLLSHQALLGVRRLGAEPDRYLVHYYGRGAGTEGSAVPSDRVRTVWRLNDPRVVERVSGASPTRESDSERWKGSSPVLETEVGEHGLRRPVSVEEPSAPRVHLEIPFDLALLREHEPDSMRPWRLAVRDAFRASFDLGYRVDDFAVVTADHERRSFYFLSGPKPTVTPAAP
jgi:predicted GNAT superfamily acetyltransferase